MSLLEQINHENFRVCCLWWTLVCILVSVFQSNLARKPLKDINIFIFIDSFHRNKSCGNMAHETSVLNYVISF